MRSRRLSRSVTTVALVGLLAVTVGCGSADDSGSTSSTAPGATDVISPLEHPAGPDELVLRVERGGGFVPVEVAFAELPFFSLLGDGSLITTGPMVEIYPPPALPNLLVQPVSEDGIQQILRWAREAGLFEEGVDWGQPTITDVGGTTFTIVADGQTHVQDIYALGYEGDASGLTQEQMAARRKVLDFHAKLGDLGGSLGDAVGSETSYEFEALAVLVSPADAVEPDPSGIEPQILEWPLGDLSTLGEPGNLGRQATVAGGDLDALLPLLQTANTLTLWKSGEGFYRLAVRPLVPDQLPVE
jgi:hypothetical protein